MPRHDHVTRLLPAAALAALLTIGLTGCDGTTADPTSRFGGMPGTTSAAQAEPSDPSSSSVSAAPDPGKPDKEHEKALQKDLAVDYRHLLVQAEHLSDDEDTFTARNIDTNPGGMPGASAFFVNADDTRAISDTVVLYPDASTATATLERAREALGTKVVGGTPTPTPVGTDGVMISGTSPEGDKAVTELMFTQGRALVRLEFESAVGDNTTDRFVTNVGKMQLIALQTGLTETE